MDHGAQSSNQANAFEGINLFTSDLALRGCLAGIAERHLDELAAFGACMGSAPTWALASTAHRHAPQLNALDRYGNRQDEVEYHPAYHEMMRIGIGAGISASPWSASSGGHRLHAALEFLLAEVEPSVCCPITMTYAAPAALKHQEGLLARWLPRILTAAYDPAFRPAAEKSGVTIGMAMTEKQGGSDIRSNTTRAEPAGDGTFRLTGHKWFCSAPMSDAFLTLAQAPGGLTCFLVPRWTAEGRRNDIHLIRLKDKLGDRANASAEIEYHGAEAWRVGEEGRGIATILDMVHHTRLDCAIAPAAYMRSALAQALWYDGQRSAFGRALIDQPLMRRVLADLALESEAGTALAFRVARSFDEAQGDEAAALFSRIATPIAKYWLNKRVVPHVAECMECLGGAGYVETWPLARLYRQAPLNGIWEGSGNVICLDVLRALSRDRRSAEALIQELEPAKGADRHLDRTIADIESLLQAPARSAEADARALVETLALGLEAAILVRQAPSFIADAFCAGRLNERGSSFGASTASADIDAILARAFPQ